MLDKSEWKISEKNLRAFNSDFGKILRYLLSKMNFDICENDFNFPKISLF